MELGSSIKTSLKTQPSKLPCRMPICFPSSPGLREVLALPQLAEHGLHGAILHQEVHELLLRLPRRQGPTCQGFAAPGTWLKEDLRVLALLETKVPSGHIESCQDLVTVPLIEYTGFFCITYIYINQDNQANRCEITRGHTASI